ncbi:MAG: GAF domain-containing protein, partial [Leptospiraceae bacterium]|nr:GAF domain-containing protein [Leptospiraceae bacterium]
LLILCTNCKNLISESSKQPEAIKGLLDLQDYWSIKSKAGEEVNLIPIKLDGEWEFYWKEFILPGGQNIDSDKPNLYSDQFNNNSNQPNLKSYRSKSYIKVPDNWNDFVNNHNLPIHKENGKSFRGKGFATYRLVVLLPENMEKKAFLPENNNDLFPGLRVLSLKLPSISSAYKLFINGSLTVETGKIGKTENETIPAELPRIINVPINKKELEIVIQISNFHYDRGGLWNSIKLGPPVSLHKERENNLLLDFFLLGSLLLIGIYHLGLFALRRNDRSTVYFGIFSILTAIRPLLTGEKYLYFMLNWHLAMKVEYLTITIGVPFFILFIHSIFPKEVPGWAKNFIVGSSGIFSLCILFLPSYYYTKTILAIEIIIIFNLLLVTYAIILAIIRKRIGAKSFFFGSIVFSIIITNDILHDLTIIHTGYYGSYGFLVFIFSQAFFLSIRSAIAFKQVESFTETLENKIEERTNQFKNANQKLEYLNEFSKLINSTNNLDLIFEYAASQLKQNFDFNLFSLHMLSKYEDIIYTRCIEIPDYFSKEIYEKLKNIHVRYKEDKGSFFTVIQKKRTMYLKDLSKIHETSKSESDKMYENTFSIKSVLQIPLLIQNEIIGVFTINKDGGMKKLSKSEISFIESFCDQLAIAVNNSELYEKIYLERQQAEIEKGIAVVAQNEAEMERAKSEKLLLNILPKEVAEELKEKGFAEPVLFDSVSVMFTDFKGFTLIAERLSPQELVKDLDACFVQFDKIVERRKLEKLKTIGDSYMCAGGIPKKNTTHAIDCLLAALEIQDFMNMMKDLKEQKGFPYWELRLGIHSGPLVAGVIGEKKFAYDVWGDTVNTASRMESSGTPGKINISGTTYELVKEFFDCEYRGEVSAKNKGMVQMYYVDGLKKEFSKGGDARTPNGKFWEVYSK